MFYTYQLKCLLGNDQVLNCGEIMHVYLLSSIPPPPPPILKREIIEITVLQHVHRFHVIPDLLLLISCDQSLLYI